MIEQDQSIGTGVSGRFRQGPSQRPLHLPRLSLEPEALSYTVKVSKTAFMPSSEQTMAEVSSAYKETTGKEDDKLGKRKGAMEGLARRLAASTSMHKTNSKGDKGQPCRTPREGKKMEEA